MIEIQVYVLSWKNVSENALKIFNDTSKIFEKCYYVDCDETSTNNFPNIIKLNDNAYYGKQFETVLNHADTQSVIGIIVGDVQINTECLQDMKNNIIDAFINYDVGIYAPFESNSYWHHKPMSQIINSNYFISNNTDCSVWFISPKVSSILKEVNISSLNHYGWGIDSELCRYSKHIGHYPIVDKSITVTNPIGRNYNFDTALAQWKSFADYIQKTGKIPPSLSPTKIHFISFSNIYSRYFRLIQRLLTQANNMNIFDTITAYTDQSSEMSSFLNEHKNFLQNNKRGFGYYIWKSYIALLKSKEVNNNDIIIYLDAGCELIKDGVERLKQYIELATINDLVAFKLPHKEYQYTKSDVFKRLNCCESQYYNSQQIMGGIFIFRKCNRMKNFFENLHSILIEDNYHYSDDTPSIIPNLDGFKESRHDQSVFSLLIKSMLKNKVAILDNETDPYEPLSNNGLFSFNNQNLPFPIKATRC
jgi:hypothetical protein